MTNYGCKWGMPHELVIVAETPRLKVERCVQCIRTFRWIKGFKGRINNTEYLKVHARSHAQPQGPTKRLYKKLYEGEKCVIRL